MTYILVISVIVTCHIRRLRRKSIVFNIITTWLKYIGLVECIYKIRVNKNK